MQTIQESIKVNRPTRDVYNQWTRFEDFPHFMEGVKLVRQIDDCHMEWEAEIAGRIKRWQAEITEQEPDRRIAWRSISGAVNAGGVSFNPVDARHCRVTVEVSYLPEGVAESIAVALGLVRKRLRRNLRNFKDYIEARARPPMGWRGKIHHSHATAMGTHARA